MNATNATDDFACQFASRYESFFYNDYETASAHFDAAVDLICHTGAGAVNWFVTGEENRDVRRAYECDGFRTVCLTASLNGKFAVCLGNMNAR